MTLESMINQIKGNLGNRSDGTIGAQNIDTAVLQAVNIGIQECAKKSDPREYDATVEISIPAGTAQVIELPLKDGKRIKDIVNLRMVRDSDGTRLTIIRCTYTQFVELTYDQQAEMEGIPSYIAFYGDNIYLNRIPTEDYTLLLYVELWPVPLTIASLTAALPINSEWELAVEAYATHYLFLKLQQTVPAAYWKDLYREQVSQNTGIKRIRDMRGSGTRAVSGDEYVFNPFAKARGY